LIPRFPDTIRRDPNPSNISEPRPPRGAARSDFMSTVSTLAHACAEDAHARVQRRLRRYSAAAQAAVQATASLHPRVADLAVSFPALLFALAVPRRGIDPARAIAAAVNGCPLAEVAQTAGVPLWLRRLPVEALTKALPELPDGDLLRRRITNHLPRSPKSAPAWLDGVAFAARWAHEPFAIWIGRELARCTKDVELWTLRRLSLWAWFSCQPGTVGHRIIETPWEPAMRFMRAVDAAGEWRVRVELHVNVGETPMADTWLMPGRVDNYEFVPLRSAADIVAEAAAMKNCLSTYGPNLAHNFSRLWSVRMNGTRVATLQLGRLRPDPLLEISELKAERNRDASIEVWWAARQWLHQHGLPAIDTKRHRWGTAPLDAAAWRTLWRPYWIAKRRLPSWLPLGPSRATLRAL
jgi:hypothetical protein